MSLPVGAAALTSDPRKSLILTLKSWKPSFALIDFFICLKFRPAVALAVAVLVEVAEVAAVAVGVAVAGSSGGRRRRSRGGGI